MRDLDDFRVATRAWLAESCPHGARGPSSRIGTEPNVIGGA